MGIISYRFVYTTCVGVIWCFLPLLASNYFDLGSSDIGILVMMMVLVGGLFHAPMGFLADRVNKHVLVVIGGLFIVGSMVSVEWANGFWGLFLSVVLFGVGGGTSLPAISAMAVLEGRRTDALGSVMSLLAMAHSLGMLVGSLIAGLTMDYMELTHAFPLGALIMVVGIVFFLVCVTGQTRAVDQGS